MLKIKRVNIVISNGRRRFHESSGGGVCEEGRIQSAYNLYDQRNGIPNKKFKKSNIKSRKKKKKFKL